ncbi:MAG: glycosyltransferase family 2 protein [Pseudomonadota bacterium]
MSAPHIAILLATYNGARFIERQLTSIAQQTHENWSLWISDDGSDDGTLDIIEAWRAAHPHLVVQLRQGPRKGAAQNFMCLLQATEIEADYFAFADQDDVWFRDKLSCALSRLPQSEKPSLYGARTMVTDMDLNEIAPSVLKGTKLGFSNALVQNFAAGNTMLFNSAARDLVPLGAAEHDIIATDWLMYMLVSGAGGHVIFDTDPCLYYRQHDTNEIGYNAHLSAKLRRVIAVLQGRFSQWSEANLGVLREARLTPDNARILDAFIEARQTSGMTAVTLLKQSGVLREGAMATRALYLAAFMGRI